MLQITVRVLTFFCWQGGLDFKALQFQTHVHQVVLVPFKWRGFEGLKHKFTAMGKEYSFDEQDVLLDSHFGKR